MNRLLFKEEQGFKQWWFWLVIAFALLAVIVPLSIKIAEDQTYLVSLNSARLILYGILVVLFLAAVLVAMLFIKLKTKITNEGIYVAYFPFVRKWQKFAVNDIEKYEIRRYRAILEYGGYGMKNKRKLGRAYTTSGDFGLQLYLKNGKKVLIGTQKKLAMEYALVKLLGNDKRKVVVKKSVSEKSAKLHIIGKAKKVLLIFALELALIIVIYGIIQLFNAF